MHVASHHLQQVVVACALNELTLLAYVTLKWRYEFPLSLLPTVDPGTVQYALDVCDVCVILRHSRGPHHQLESTDLTSPWTKKSRMRVLPWPFRSTFASCDPVLIRTHPFAFPCVGRLITVLTTRGLRWMDTKCPHGTSGCKHVCDVHSCVTSWSCNYIQNPAYTLACRLGMALADAALCPIVSFRRGSWIVSPSGATLRSWVPDDYVARLNPRAHTGAYSLAS